MEEEARKIQTSSRIPDYGAAQIREDCPNYPDAMDFTTPLAAGRHTECELRNHAQKKRAGGKGKSTRGIADKRANKRRLPQD